MLPDLWTVRAIREAVARGSCRAEDVCRAALERIAATDAVTRGFITLTPDRALARAAALDRAPRSAARGPLHGVPVAVKDNLCTAGVQTTAGSGILRGFVPPYDATVVERLERAGAVIVGKTNLDEFAMGSSTEHSAFGASRNPWDPGRTPGGSSGGSAAAVAMRQVPAALGSDTGGSVRQPAAFSGLVGLKPTYGRVSRHGLIAFASSLDQVGPITLTVEDAALVLNVIAGPDPLDATAAREPVPDFARALTGDIRGLRLGVPRTWLADGVDEAVTHAFSTAIEVLRQRGATLVDITLPHAAWAVAVYQIIATAEASSNLARYDGVRYGPRPAGATSLSDLYGRTRAAGFGREVKRRILLGTYVLSAGYYEAHYVKAQQVRTLIAEDHRRVLSEVDAMVLPTSPSAAFELGALVDDPIRMYLADVFTVGASLAGLPAVSVPMGFTPAGLPVGLQIVGRPFDEGTVFRAADAYERDTRWWMRPPPHAATLGRDAAGGPPK